MEILKNIEQIRKEKGIKQTVIAEQLGIKQPAYSNYINRNNDIWFSKVLQICDILQVSVIDLITYPVKYMPESDQCNSCKEYKKTIENLNDLITFLKSEKNLKK